jgi:hypothetical protein
MGCDIHMSYEIKKDGAWETLDWKAPYIKGTNTDGSLNLDYDKLFDDPLYVHRNYDLFAILADVRNGRGFAGIQTGEGFNPISEPRGLPEDLSQSIREDSDSWNADGHSHSWLLLSEVVNYDYDQTTTQYGMVGETEYKEWLAKGKPNSWSGGVGGPNVVHITNGQMDEIIADETQKTEGNHYYTRVEWQETYRDAVGPHWFALMKNLEERFGIDNVRLVFWFDN